MKKIAILGSTGSIGTQALDVVDRSKGEFSVAVLSCGRRIGVLSEQIEKYRPDMVAVAREEDAAALAKKYPKTEVVFGREGLIDAATCRCDMVLNSLMGIKGLEPTYHAIKAGKDIALANKETLVAGGELIMAAVKDAPGRLLPVDSEHSAIFQCLQGNSQNKIKSIILTASGGPFRGYTLKQLESVTLEQALAHPKWNMGKKITIDSATLMNKGLEVIEAKWLFDVSLDQIRVVVHPQSIVHSGVEYEDTSVVAQLGVPDMKVPISYALNYPQRSINNFETLDFFGEGANLTFEKPDMETFKCIKLAFEASRLGGAYPIVMNGANEVLVQNFLEGKIRFIDIQNTLEEVLDSYSAGCDMSLEGILATDAEARRETIDLLEQKRRI